MAKTAGSKYEDELAKQLTEHGIPFERQYRYDPSRKWKADFLLRDWDVLVEVQGISYRGQAYGHQTGAAYQQDCMKHNEASIRGYRVLFFTPAMVMGNAKELRKGSPRMERAIDTIIRYIHTLKVGNSRKKAV